MVPQPQNKVFSIRALPCQVADQRRSSGCQGGRRTISIVENIECDVMVERSTEYLEGGLHGNELTQVVDHLHVCPACEVYLDEVRATVLLAADLPPEPVSEALAATLLAMYREWVESVA